MKFISVVYVLILFQVAHSQDDDVFKSQLQKIIVSARNDFKEFCGTYEKSKRGYFCHSTITLSGTTDNVIGQEYSDSAEVYPVLYWAKIDSCDKRKANNLIRAWAKRIKKISEEKFDKKKSKVKFPIGSTMSGKAISLTSINCTIEIFYIGQDKSYFFTDELNQNRGNSIAFHRVYLIISKRISN